MIRTYSYNIYDIKLFFHVLLVHFVSFPKIYSYMGFIDIYCMSFLIIWSLCFFVQISKIILVPKELSFSKFYSYIPTVSSSDCKKHQNIKLMIVPIPNVKNYKKLLDILVCDLCNKDCIIHSWFKWPGKEKLKRFYKKYLMRKISRLQILNILNIQQCIQ